MTLTINDWAPTHQATAQAEGWDIFDNGEDYSEGQWTASRIDDPQAWGLNMEPLPDDCAVWSILHRGFVGGSLLHLHAVNILREVNPAEYDRVMAA